MLLSEYKHIILVVHKLVVSDCELCLQLTFFNTRVALLIKCYDK